VKAKSLAEVRAKWAPALAGWRASGLPTP
jgi:hypothetical protein